MDVFEKWTCSDNKDKTNIIVNFIQTSFGLGNYSENIYQSLMKFCKLLCLIISTKWEKCYRTCHRFIAKHSKWLKSETILPDYIESLINTGHQPSTSRGIPLKEFSESSAKTKKTESTGYFKKHIYERNYFCSRAVTS